MDPLVASLVTLAAVVGLILLALFITGGGGLARFGLGWTALSRVMRNPEFAEKVRPLLEPQKPKDDKPPKPSGAPLRLLALLQRDGRFLDFVLDSVQGYGDDQIAAAVRSLHPKWQAAIKDHLELQPVLPNGEGDSVTVPAGFDPSAIRVTGNVTGEPPFRGTLQHHGWRVTNYRLAAPPEGQDELVLAPAEVEIPLV
jgi:hypothetical protein